MCWAFLQLGAEQYRSILILKSWRCFGGGVFGGDWHCAFHVRFFRLQTREVVSTSEVK